VVGGALNVGFAAHGCDAAARDAHIAQQKLDDAHGADVLRPDGVLRPAHRVEIDAGAVGLAGGAVELVHFEKFIDRSAADLADEFRRVAGIVFFQKLEDTVGMLHRRIFADDARAVRLIRPGVFFIFPVGKAGEHALVVAGQFQRRIDQESGVGVMPDVLLEIQLVFENVPDHAAQESDVRSRTKRGVQVRLGGGLGKARIHADDFRIPRADRFLYPFPGDGVVGSGVASHD